MSISFYFIHFHIKHCCTFLDLCDSPRSFALSIPKISATMSPPICTSQTWTFVKSSSLGHCQGLLSGLPAWFTSSNYLTPHRVHWLRVQFAFHTCGFCILGFKRLWIENKWKNIASVPLSADFFGHQSPNNPVKQLFIRHSHYMKYYKKISENLKCVGGI